MAVAMKDATEAVISDPKNHSDTNVSSAYQISRLIRNAFSHGPFNPKWSVDPDCRNKTFAVRDIIAIDTKGLDRAVFDWRQYGGPLALLRLSEFVRKDILGDDSSVHTTVALPRDVYYQIGELTVEAREFHSSRCSEA